MRRYCTPKSMTASSVVKMPMNWRGKKSATQEKTTAAAIPIL